MNNKDLLFGNTSEYDLELKRLDDLDYAPRCSKCSTAIIKSYSTAIIKSYKPRHFMYYQNRATNEIICVSCVSNERIRRNQEEERIALDNCKHEQCKVTCTDFNGNPTEVQCMFCKEINYIGQE